MVNRRRFLLLLGAATSGVWLASTGLVQLERRFVLELAGSCSFCGKSRAETKALVGTLGRPVKICDECVGLCWDIMAEESHAPSPLPEGQPLPPQSELEAQIAEMLQHLAREKEERAREALLTDARRALDKPWKAPDFACTFCDADRRDVAKLISGPRVFICDRCVGDATSVIAHVLRA